ncbi:hypothetical protein ACQPU1_00105 [Clostridium paraputrificum]|uniref:hypothetical protein n=1 Tax=Clostridium TaxID=1485 RepID=UPI003D32B61F
MSKLVGCTLIIRDDFNNILILKKKVKRGQNEIWSLLTQKIRGKESAEKCVHRGVKDILKSVVFDLEPLKEHLINEENDESVMTFVGTLKERVILDKTYKEFKWVGKKQLDNLEILDWERKILEDYLG